MRRSRCNHSIRIVTLTTGNAHPTADMSVPSIASQYATSLYTTSSSVCNQIDYDSLMDEVREASMTWLAEAREQVSEVYCHSSWS